MSEVGIRQDGFVAVIAEAELRSGEQRALTLSGVPLLLCRDHRGQLHAVTNVCPHALLPLTGGKLEGCALTCPKHGARFDLVSGRPLNEVAATGLRLHEVAVREGSICVRLGSMTPARQQRRSSATN